MRAIKSGKSGKNLLRFAGLAAVFMLAVTLAVSAVSLTRGNAGTGDVVSNDVAFAAGSIHLGGDQYAQLVAEYTYPIVDIDSLKASPIVYSMNDNDSYDNFFLYNDNGLTNAPQGSSTATSAKYSRSHSNVNNYQIGLYTYFKLPDFLLELGADITVKMECVVVGNNLANDNAVVRNIVRCNVLQTGNTYTGETVSASGVCSSAYPYLRASFSGQQAIAGTDEITVSDLTITITINNLTQTKTTHIESWDGDFDTAPVSYYGNNYANAKNQNYGEVGVVTPGADTVKPDTTLYSGDSNSYDAGSNFSTINFTALKTSAYDSEQTKSFSFLIYDNFFGLKSATFRGLDLLAPYTRTESPLSPGSVHEFTAANTNTVQNPYAFPEGLTSVKVEPFGYETSAESSTYFRGLRVSVVYNGKKLNNKGEYIGIEADSPYVLSATNNMNTNMRNVTVTMGGLDYTGPTLPTLEFVSNYTETSSAFSGAEFSGYTNYIWFDTKDVQFRLNAEADSRDIVTAGEVKYADVRYSRSLYYNDGTIDAPVWVLVGGQSGDYNGNGDFTGDSGVNLPNYGGSGSALTFDNLANGFYRVSFFVSDTYGRVNPTNSDHNKTSGYTYFAVDTTSMCDSGEKWLQSVTPGVGGFANYDFDAAPWTKDNITVRFNNGGTNGINSIVDGGIIYEYKLVTTGKKTQFRDWDTFDPNADPMAANSFLICRDSLKYTDSADRTAAWYSPDGFQRAYSFKATLISGKVYEFTINVSFDDVANVKPYSYVLASAHNTETKAYTDLLARLTDIVYLDSNDNDNELSPEELKGSPRKVYVSKDGGTTWSEKPLELISDDTEAYIDLFGGTNVNAPTQLTVQLKFLDEAGNSSLSDQYTVWLDTAKLYAKFTSKTTSRYYTGTDVVPAGLLSCALFRDAEFKVPVSTDDMRVTFSNVYDSVNAGLRNVMVSNIVISLADENSKYEATFDADGKTKYAVIGVNVDGDEVTDLTKAFAATKHTIQKARLVLGQHYVGEALVDIAANTFTFQYNGTTRYPITEKQDKDTFACVDSAPASEWEKFTWTAVVNASGGVSVDSLGNAQPRDVTLTNIVIYDADGNVIYDADGNAISDGNYQVVAKSKIPGASIGMKAVLTKKNITLELKPLTKEYDGDSLFTVTAAHYELKGLFDGAKVTLNHTLFKSVNFTNDAGVAQSKAGSYIVTIDAVLSGQDAQSYKLVDAEGNAINKAVFRNATITKKHLTVEFGRIRKVFDNTTALPTLTQAAAGNNLKPNEYSIEGLLGSDAAAVIPVGTYDNVNRGNYSLKVTVTLSALASGNYELEQTEYLVGGEITPREVTTISITGIYAVYNNAAGDERYYYISGTAGNQIIYVENSQGGYYAYNNAGTQSTVTALPAGAQRWIITSFTKEDGGFTRVFNNQSFKLSSIEKYAIAYDAAAVTGAGFANFDYNLALNSPKITSTQKGDKTGYDISFTYRFADTSNFYSATADNAAQQVFSLTELDFSDIVFENKLYYKINGTEFDNGGGLSIIFNNQDIYLKLDSTKLKNGALDTGYPQYAYIPADSSNNTRKNAGTYTAKITVEREGTPYILNVQYTIIKITTEVEFSNSSLYKADFGDDFTAAVQNVTVDAKYQTAYGVNVPGAMNYEYSTSRTDFDGNMLLEAPVAAGSGDYYVRGRYPGSTNFTAATTDIRQIYVGNINFNISDVVVKSGETVPDPNMRSYIVGDKYKDFGGSLTEPEKSLFVVVYRQPIREGDEWQPAGVYKTEKPTAVGNYDMRIVHRDLVDADGNVIPLSERTTTDGYLVALTAGKISAKLTIGQTTVASTGADRRANQLGSLNATTNYPILPTIHESAGTLFFEIEDLTDVGLYKDTFNNGLNDNQTLLGGTYQVNVVYDTKLYQRSRLDTSITNVSGEIGVVSLTIKAENLGSGTKLVRFVTNTDGSYTADVIEYTDNGNGTITFDTNKLGWFVLADAYEPAKEVDNGLTIGLSVGGGVIVLLVAMALGLGLKRRRLF